MNVSRYVYISMNRRIIDRYLPDPIRMEVQQVASPGVPARLAHFSEIPPAKTHGVTPSSTVHGYTDRILRHFFSDCPVGGRVNPGHVGQGDQYAIQVTELGNTLCKCSPHALSRPLTQLAGNAAGFQVGGELMIRRPQAHDYGKPGQGAVERGGQSLGQPGAGTAPPV